MKRFSIILAVLGIFMMSDALNVSTIVSEDIKGTYWNAEKTAHIRIYKAKNGKYYGKIEHLEEPNDVNGNPKKDPENPKEELRSRDRLGMVIMTSFDWNESEKRWDDGNIYDPSNGKTYDGYARFEGDKKDKLFLRGFVMGMTWLGRTSEWERIK